MIKKIENIKLSMKYFKMYSKYWVEKNQSLLGKRESLNTEFGKRLT